MYLSSIPGHLFLLRSHSILMNATARRIVSTANAWNQRAAAPTEPEASKRFKIREPIDPRPDRIAIATAILLRIFVDSPCESSSTILTAYDMEGSHISNTSDEIQLLSRLQDINGKGEDKDGLGSIS